MIALFICHDMSGNEIQGERTNTKNSAVNAD